MSAEFLPEEFHPSLMEAAEKAEDIFHNNDGLSGTMESMVDLLVGLVRRWKDEGLVSERAT